MTKIDKSNDMPLISILSIKLLFLLNEFRVFRVGINSDGLFSLVPDDASKKTSKGHCHFRPFGILEPLSAKAARLDITKAFPLICELANTKCRLNELNEKYRKLKESLVSVA